MTWNENLYTTCAVQVGVSHSEPLYSPLCLLYKYQQGNVWGQDDRPREIPGQGQLGDGLVAGVHQKDDVHGEWGDPFWNFLTEAWGLRECFRAKPRGRTPWTCSTPRRSRSTGLRTTWTPSTPRWRRLTRPWLGWRNGAACSSVPGTGQYEEKVRI